MCGHIIVVFGLISPNKSSLSG